MNYKYYQDYGHCFQHLIYEYPNNVPKAVNFAEAPTEYEFKMSRYPNSPGQIFLVDKEIKSKESLDFGV